ncbi:MAG: DUF655 domain-containing protein [Candidatus Methanofastidiosa archaeon]|nr:DUF655 domain-containing protein [Candidatus Methanofastidiosa archaeon]
MVQKRFETEAIVLDYLQSGHLGDNTPSYKRVPIAQIIGVNFFSLLEVVPKSEVSTHDIVFIGKGDRQKVSHVKRRITYDELTSFAKSEIDEVLKEIIMKDEKRFVNFFNKSQPLSIRYHQLELLPGVGKKLMKEILTEREKRDFDSFKDIQERISSIPDPLNMIVKRIISELNDEDRYKIFVNPIFR